MPAARTKDAAGTRLLGLEIPFEAQQALRMLPTLGAFDDVLKAVLAHALGTAPASPEVARSLQHATSLDTSNLGALFTGLHWILRVCMRSSLKPKALQMELTDCRVHPPFLDMLVQAVEQGCVQEPVNAARCSPTKTRGISYLPSRAATPRVPVSPFLAPPSAF
jgi:hypothetical protein